MSSPGLHFSEWDFVYDLVAVVLFTVVGSVLVRSGVKGLIFVHSKFLRQRPIIRPSGAPAVAPTAPQQSATTSSTGKPSIVSKNGSLQPSSSAEGASPKLSAELEDLLDEVADEATQTNKSTSSPTNAKPSSANSKAPVVDADDLLDSAFSEFTQPPQGKGVQPKPGSPATAGVKSPGPSSQSKSAAPVAGLKRGFLLSGDEKPTPAKPAQSTPTTNAKPVAQAASSKPADDHDALLDECLAEATAEAPKPSSPSKPTSPPQKVQSNEPKKDVTNEATRSKPSVVVPPADDLDALIDGALEEHASGSPSTSQPVEKKPEPEPKANKTSGSNAPSAEPTASVAPTSSSTAVPEVTQPSHEDILDALLNEVE
jgi:hypothetical protein